MGLPPVVVGLFVTIFLWRNGPLGFFGILYTPTAMIYRPGSHRHSYRHGHHPGGHPATSPKTPPSDSGPRGNAAPDGLDPDQGGEASLTGCGDGRVWRRHLGGGRLHHGRRKYQGIFPGSYTATVMETSRGNFDIAIALRIILLLLAYFINLILTHIQQRERPR